MSRSRVVFVIVAHQDDWQIFMGGAVYAALRDPSARVVVITTTAGDAGDTPAHWKSRLSGSVLSFARGLSAWSPYATDLPASLGVAYSRERVNEKCVLLATIDDGTGRTHALYFLHLPDGGPAGTGYAPNHESLANLRGGTPVHTLWPEETPCVYECWDELEATLTAIVRRERQHDEPAEIFAADPDVLENPGDHVDHALTSAAAQAIAERDPSLVPTWFAMYCIAERPENRHGAHADDQRAAIYAYGGGYMANAAGFGESWRTGWEREYPCFKNRQYARREEPLT